MKHVVMFSGGVGSWMAAKRVVERHGAADTILLFTDTLMEDEDTYPFLQEAAADAGAPLEIIKDGRNPWQVFHDVRFIGNNRASICSRVLKQEPARKWIEERFGPDDVVIYLGIDWTEQHRLEPAQRGWAPYRCEAPMCEEPYLAKADMLEQLKSANIRTPRLYLMGFPHQNCGGGCVKAGIAQWPHLLKTMPERYRWHEEHEEALRAYLGKDIAILRDRSSRSKCKHCRGAGMIKDRLCDDCDGTGKATRPLTLKELRENTGLQVDLFDWGGCGCFLGDDEPQACTIPED